MAAPPYGAPPVGPAPAWGYPAHSYRPPYGQTPAQLPDTLPYREGRPPPAGYVLESQKYRGLWLSGTITLGATWFMSAISAGMLLDDEKGAVAPLFAPVLGPFIAIGTLDTDSPGTTALLVDGVAQTAGAALLIAGLVAERKVWVRDYFAVTATPVVSKELSGFALIGEM